MYNEEMHELYHVIWRPQPATQFPVEDPFHPVPTPHASALDYLSKRKTPSKPAGAYRPPGARGAATPLSFKREDEGGAAFVRKMMSGKEPETNGFAHRPKRREVPGAETVDPKLPPGAAPGGGVSLTGVEGDEGLSKAALKNKKKREAKKAKEAEAKAAGLAAPNGESNPEKSPEHKDRPRSRSNTNKGGNQGSRPQSRRREGSRQRGPPLNTTQLKQQPANGTPAAPAAGPVGQNAPDLTVTSPGAGSPHEKKIRSLLKKLRAIDDLKMRQAGGEKLEGTQVLKIGTEEGVRKELNALGYTGD